MLSFNVGNTLVFNLVSQYWITQESTYPQLNRVSKYVLEISRTHSVPYDHLAKDMLNCLSCDF